MSVTSIELVRRVLRAVSAGAIFYGAMLLFSTAAFHPAYGSILYGDFTGNTVKYLAVTEAANSAGDVAPLFGAPTISGDSLSFNPSGFNAHAGGALGNDTTDGNLMFGVQALPSFIIKNLNLSEGGDTTLSSSGFGVGTNNTNTSVTADGFLNISEVNNVGITPISIPIALSFTPSGGLYQLVTNGGGFPIYHTAFNGSLFLDLNALLATNGYPAGGATKISINIDNTLVANSELNTSAVIAKKNFGGVSITVNNPLGGGGPNSPEPTSLVLACLGFAGLFAKRLWVK
jgi:hypothetical protein